VHRSTIKKNAFHGKQREEAYALVPIPFVLFGLHTRKTATYGGLKNSPLLATPLSRRQI
jgi:hypothetical protein